jgi:hypothetical protein
MHIKNCYTCNRIHLLLIQICIRFLHFSILKDKQSDKSVSREWQLTSKENIGEKRRRLIGEGGDARRCLRPGPTACGEGRRNSRGLRGGGTRAAASREALTYYRK